MGSCLAMIQESDLVLERILRKDYRKNYRKNYKEIDIGGQGVIVNESKLRFGDQ